MQIANINSITVRTRPHQISQILKAGISYFAVVFGAGFILGPIRILLVAPHLGERTAELLEAPLMLVVIVMAAKWVIHRSQIPPPAINRILIGLLALALGLLFEFVLVLKLRGLTITEYFRTRDPISGAVYYLSLGMFAVMPLLVGRTDVEGRRKRER